MSKKVLITGCSGFLGSHLLRLMREDKDYLFYGITEVDKCRSPQMEVHHLDIRDRDKVFRAVEAIRPDVVFHLAAIANVGFSWKHQKATYEINFIGSSNLMEALHAFAPACRVLMLSSAELYGNCGNTPIRENAGTPPPKNPYSLSKAAMEMVGQLYMDSHKMDVIILRSFNFTGPGQDRKFMASDFSRQIAEIEKGFRDPVIRVGNLSAVRDISDVRDIARYLAVIAQKGERGKTYNLCSGKTYAIKEILDMLLSLSSQKIDVMVDEAKLRPVDIPVLWGDNRLIRDRFNLGPRIEIRQTLSDLLAHWRERIEEDIEDDRG